MTKSSSFDHPMDKPAFKGNLQQYCIQRQEDLKTALSDKVQYQEQLTNESATRFSP